jgi:hypothetical protein
VLSDDDLRRLEEIEEWFHQHGYTLHYDVDIDEDGFGGFVVYVMKNGVRVGTAVPWGGGSSQLEAAEEAKAEALASLARVSATVEMPLESGAGVASQATIDIPLVKRERLEKVASEFRWSIGFVQEPDGSFRWFVSGDDGRFFSMGSQTIGMTHG